MNDWSHIRAFLAVAETGSLSAAANKLALSQPTLGRYITALEGKTGEALFVRGRNGMALTKSGLALIDDAKAMAAAAMQFDLKAAGREQQLSGTVRITASDVVATYLLPEVLTRLIDAEPQMAIELVPSNNIENLLSRDADIAVRMVRPMQNDLITQKVNEMSMATFAHKDYLARHGTPKNLEDFYHHRVIGYDRDDLMLRQMAALGLKASRDYFTFRTDDQVAYWELLKTGAGIGFGPRYIGALSPELVSIPTPFDIPPLPMWLTSHAELKTNARIRRAMDFLSAELKALDL